MAALRCKEEALQRQLAGQEKRGKGKRQGGEDLRQELRKATRRLETEQERLQVASQAAGSHYERQNVPRGGQ